MSVTELQIEKNEKILVISPHPDDESIGVGGLLSLYPNQCKVIVMTDGRYGNANYKPNEMIDIRKSEFVRAMECIGVSDYEILGYEDGTLLQNKSYFDKIDYSEYSYIFVPNPHDNHGDHTACFEYVVELIKKRKIEEIRVLKYEVHTPLSDVNCYIDISSVLKKKKKLLESYVSQLETHPYEKQILALAEYRGYQEEKSGKYLETYQEVLLDENINGITVTEIELTKYKQFAKIFSDWIFLKNRNRELGDFLREKNFSKVAIYGYGIMGRVLLDELVKNDIQVKYIIDLNQKVKVPNFEVHHKIDDLEAVDSVIITTLAHYEEIELELKQKCGLKGLSFKKILEEMKG